MTALALLAGALAAAAWLLARRVKPVPVERADTIPDAALQLDAARVLQLANGEGPVGRLVYPMARSRFDAADAATEYLNSIDT